MHQDTCSLHRKLNMRQVAKLNLSAFMSWK
jgi:hypothetical protein